REGRRRSRTLSPAWPKCAEGLCFARPSDWPALTPRSPSTASRPDRPDGGGRRRFLHEDLEHRPRHPGVAEAIGGFALVGSAWATLACEFLGVTRFSMHSTGGDRTCPST